MFYTLPRAIKEEKKNEEGVGSLELKERARFGNLKLKKKGRGTFFGFLWFEKERKPRGF